MANYLDQEITVTNEKALSEAVKNKYGKIILEGDVAESVGKELSKFSKKEKLRKLSLWGTAIGLIFWPLLIAGVAGIALTGDDLKSYSIKADGKRLIMKHKKAKI